MSETVRVDRVWCVADSGLVVNPDGARNQLEGGVIQAVSWTLKEQVKLDDQGIASRDWDAYPILRFSEVPEIRAELVDGAGNPTLGVGECSVGPTAAAVGNAVAHVLTPPFERFSNASIQRYTRLPAKFSVSFAAIKRKACRDSRFG